MISASQRNDTCVRKDLMEENSDAHDNLASTKDPRASSDAVRRSMRANRSKDTKPELLLRKALWAAGVRGYRKNVKNLPGKPDLVFGPQRLAIFVHGCFWHRCPTCIRNLSPKQNSEFWSVKFARNVARDKQNADRLRALGYRTIVVWECELKKSVDEAVWKILAERNLSTSKQNASSREHP